MTEPHKVSDCCCSGDHDDNHNDNDDDSDDDNNMLILTTKAFLFNETDEAQKWNLKTKFQWV